MRDLFPRGVFCAVLTSVTEELSPDMLALARHCRWLIEQGCDGVALLGTTGEANSFSASQRMRLLEGVIEAGIPAECLLPGTGCAALAALKAATSLRMNQPSWDRVVPPLVALTTAEREVLRDALAAKLPAAPWTR
jgi:dihydrodipicolinate synthase/N-acetylneuraminate lyase